MFLSPEQKRVRTWYFVVRWKSEKLYSEVAKDFVAVDVQDFQVILCGWLTLHPPTTLYFGLRKFKSLKEKN